MILCKDSHIGFSHLRIIAGLLNIERLWVLACMHEISEPPMYHSTQVKLSACAL